MPRSAQPAHVTTLAELRAWYLGSLRPKLTRAATTGTVAPAAADALDRQLRDFLDLPASPQEEAA